MIGVISISLYLLIVTVIYVLSKNKYVLFQQNNAIYNKKTIGTKMPILYLLFFSILFVLLNAYCTANSVGYGVDRTNYYIDFYGRETVWGGFNFILSIIRERTSNFHVFLYITTFMCCVIAFLAYKYSNDTTPKFLLFFLSTNYVIATFVNLKQCYVNAFAAIFFCLIMQPRTMRRNIACVVIMILACYFHVTGFFLFPIFIYCLFHEKRIKHINIWLLLLIITFIFFEQLIIYIGKHTINILPNLSGKIIEYFIDNTSHVDEGSIMSFLKGMPYYLLFVWGLIHHKSISLIERNYDKCLMITALGVFLILTSIYSYWLIRFNTLFFFPMGCLYSMLMKFRPQRERQIMSFLVIGSSFFFTFRTILLTFINYRGL